MVNADMVEAQAVANTVGVTGNYRYPIFFRL